MTVADKAISTTATFTKRYAKSPILRALVELIPYVGGATDTFIVTKYQNIVEERTKALFNELEIHGAKLSDELINSNDFIHCYMLTARAAINTRRTEKIRLFARLLASSFSDMPPRDIEEFEELLKIVDELSFNEWRALAILDQHTSTPRSDEENDLQWTWKFWNDFRQAAGSELGIPTDEFVPFMTRLGRSGYSNCFRAASLTMNRGRES